MTDQSNHDSAATSPVLDYGVASYEEKKFRLPIPVPFLFNLLQIPWYIIFGTVWYFTRDPQIDVVGNTLAVGFIILPSIAAATLAIFKWRTTREETRPALFYLALPLVWATLCILGAIYFCFSEIWWDPHDHWPPRIYP